MLVRYSGVWMSMNETRITRATFQMIDWDLSMKKSCGMRMMRNPKTMFNNYTSCVKNMVNIFYRDIAIGMEV
jgi:hypothetical protein